MQLLFELFVILLGTNLFGNLSIRCRQPAVLGKLIFGIVIGPAVLGWVQPSEVIVALSQIGVILLMFIAGLETDLEEMKKHSVASLLVALGGMVLPFGAGYIFGIYLGFQTAQAVFLGLLLSATSVSITVQTLREMGRFKTKESAIILGAALIDDILVVLAMAVTLSFVTTESISLSMVFGKKVLFFMILAMLSWKLVPWFMRKFTNFKTEEALITAGLIICLFFAYLGELLGVAGIIGAFFAGIAISQTEFKKDVEHKIEPIAYAIFVPVFFVSIGLSISFSGIANNLWTILALCFIAIVSKWLGAGVGAKLAGVSTRGSVCIGAGMVSRGEVALIIAALGFEKQLLLPQYFTIVVLVIIVTTLVAPPLLKLSFGKNQSLDEA